MDFDDFVRDVAIGAVGYAIGKRKNEYSEPIFRDCSEEYVLEDYIKKFAQKRGIYDRDQRFAEELHKIAKMYEDPFYYKD